MSEMQKPIKPKIPSPTKIIIFHVFKNVAGDILLLQDYPDDILNGYLPMSSRSFFDMQVIYNQVGQDFQINCHYDNENYITLEKENENYAQEMIEYESYSQRLMEYNRLLKLQEVKSKKIKIAELQLKIAGLQNHLNHLLKSD